MILSIVLTFFILLGAVSAVDTSDVSIKECSNLDDNVDTLSLQNKLEISNEDSISETNIVNSHDDNLEDYSSDIVLSSSSSSNYDDRNGTLKSSFTSSASHDNLSSSSSKDDALAVSLKDNVVSSSSDKSKLGASKKVATKLSVADTSYSKSGTIFKVTLKDNSGNTLKNQKISLKVKGKTYSAKTNKKGIASIKTAALSIGKYTTSLSYAGNSNYSASSLSKKVKVLSSVKGKDITKYYGYTSTYKATFLKNGEALANTKVSFKIDGKKLTRTTNKKGVAKVGVYLTVGKHVITSTNPYSGQKLSNTILVKKDHATLNHTPYETYIPPKTKYVFTVLFKSKHHANIKEGRIYFTYKGKTVSALTDKNGKASIVLPKLSKGTFTMKYKFMGTPRFYACSGMCQIIVKKSKCTVNSPGLKMTYGDGSKFPVILKRLNKPLKHKDVKFVIKGKTYIAKTNAKGVAKLSVAKFKPGTYKVKYYFSTKGSKYYTHGSNKLVISKMSAKLSAKNLIMEYKDGSVYKATVKDKSGKPIKGTTVIFKMIKKHPRKTNSKGIAKYTVNLKVGYYHIKSTVSDPYYKSNTVSKHILVNGTKFIAKQVYVSVGKSVSYSVKAVDGQSNPIKKAKITFTVDGKKYTAKTNSKGVAKVKLGKLSKGSHKIKFSSKSYSGTSTIHVVNKITLKQLIAACKRVNGYIEDNEKLPSKVKIGSLYYSTADFLYLVSKAILNLKSGSKADIPVLKVAKPKKPGNAYDQGNLYDYRSVAKSLVKTAKSKGIMPNYVNSQVGKIGYKGVVFALSRVVAFYGDEKIMPAYTAVRSLSEPTTGSLNSRNTIKNLKPYLAATTNCQVKNAKIKQVAAKLTKGLTSEKAKARAIFNYVRDTISYSFYYDTRYGAVGTLNAGTGNCVDHAHLVVALSRAAGLPARYVHGTCTFMSGTYGHVWAQVLVGNTWTVCDATSVRNSYGNVVNWNPSTYSLHGYYSDLQF